jgi:type VI protein secretion system component VasF
MADADIDSPLVRTLDIREKLAHIDQMLADHDRKRQEIRYQPWLAVTTGMTAGAAIFAAALAFIKVLG